MIDFINRFKKDKIQYDLFVLKEKALTEEDFQETFQVAFISLFSFKEHGQFQSDTESNTIWPL